MSDVRQFLNAHVRANRQAKTERGRLAIIEEWCVAPMYVKPGLYRLVRLEDVSDVIRLEREMQERFRNDAAGEQPALD